MTLLVTLLVLPSAWAGAADTPPMSTLMALAGAQPGDTAPERMRLTTSPTRDEPMPLYQAIMAQPVNAPYRVGMLMQAYQAALPSPLALVALTGAVAGLTLERSAERALQPLEARLRAAADPLAASLAWMASMTQPGVSWPPGLPDQAQLPNPLRFELAMLLATLGQSQQFLQLALARLPATATPALLRRQALDGEFLPFEAPDYRQWLALVEREALLAGMFDLVAAAERLQHFVAASPTLPALAWTLDTPMGQIVLDTTGRDNQYQLRDPLLVLDVGGNDRYEFLARGESHRISVLIDHQGNDQYLTTAPGADPSGATLGYGILWDTQGDDVYQGTQQAQASALFGAALLVDGGGANRFEASSHAQAHAIGGLALLLSGTGSDQFSAQTHAQGSAGPQGVALLLEPGGNDRYTLGNTPLIRPSPQLPGHNTSMGQGAGRGVRADLDDRRSTAGGIGMLLDLAGSDHYIAQVFAQGAGFQEGLGLLVDDGGDDQFEAAWYAMGAAAHRGAGLLLKRGGGNDRYQVSHSTSLGAAHDFSVGILLDEGGNDQYALGDLGLGAAHDNSVALFVDGAGDERYQLSAAACRAFGAAQISEWGTLRESFLNLGLFMDLGGVDAYPAQCARARNDSAWAAPRAWPRLGLRSEAGAGFDGVAPLPFAIRPLTTPALPEKSR